MHEGMGEVTEGFTCPVTLPQIRPHCHMCIEVGMYRCLIERHTAFRALAKALLQISPKLWSRYSGQA